MSGKADVFFRGAGIGIKYDLQLKMTHKLFVEVVFFGKNQVDLFE